MYLHKPACARDVRTKRPKSGDGLRQPEPCGLGNGVVAVGLDQEILVYELILRTVEIFVPSTYRGAKHP